MSSEPAAGRQPVSRRPHVTDLLAAAAGAVHRGDLARSPGVGPAGNARLTAWTGLLLLALFAVEGFTLLSLGAMITVHIVIGALLVPLLLFDNQVPDGQPARR